MINGVVVVGQRMARGGRAKGELMGVAVVEGPSIGGGRGAGESVVIGVGAIEGSEQLGVAMARVFADAWSCRASSNVRVSSGERKAEDDLL